MTDRDAPLTGLQIFRDPQFAIRILARRGDLHHATINATIQASGAEEVWLTHGSTGPMTRWLVERDVNARSIVTRFEGEADEEPIAAED